MIFFSYMLDFPGIFSLAAFLKSQNKCGFIETTNYFSFQFKFIRTISNPQKRNASIKF